MENKSHSNEEKQVSFLRTPKLLFDDEKFKAVSMSAKYLYSFMLDRLSLSMKNNWVDDEGRVYIYFTINDAMERLKVCKDKAMRLFKELDDKNGCGLIHRKRQGLGKPDVIYVENFFDRTETPTSCGMETPTSGMLKNQPQEVCETDSNNTNINNNNINNTEMNNILSYQEISDKKDELSVHREKVLKNIDYKTLTANYGKDRIDGIVEIMLDAISSKRKHINIGCERKLQVRIKQRLLELNYSHIEYVLECLNKNRTEIKNIKSYILTALYNSVATMNCYYTNQVQYDLHKRRSIA